MQVRSGRDSPASIAVSLMHFAEPGPIRRQQTLPGQQKGIVASELPPGNRFCRARVASDIEMPRTIRDDPS